MVTVDYMISSALRCDTTLSRAMLRACGILVPQVHPRRGLVVSVNAYNNMIECFRNTSSPMDW